MSRCNGSTDRGLSPNKDQLIVRWENMGQFFRFSKATGFGETYWRSSTWGEGQQQMELDRNHFSNIPCSKNVRTYVETCQYHPILVFLLLVHEHASIDVWVWGLDLRSLHFCFFESVQ